MTFNNSGKREDTSYKLRLQYVLKWFSLIGFEPGKGFSGGWGWRLNGKGDTIFSPC